MSNYKVKCKFCPTLDLTYSGHVGSYTSGWAPRTKPSEMYCCLKCKTNFFFIEERLIGWTFKEIYKNANFAVEWFEETGQTILYENWKVVFKVAGATSITPHNLLQKLPVYLTFL
jgi:hypothetical protein